MNEWFDRVSIVKIVISYFSFVLAVPAVVTIYVVFDLSADIIYFISDFCKFLNKMCIAQIRKPNRQLMIHIYQIIIHVYLEYFFMTLCFEYSSIILKKINV